MTAALAWAFVAACAASPLLIIDPRSVAPDADGSRAKPFRTSGATLQAARDGDTVDLGTGLYTEGAVGGTALLGGKATVLGLEVFRVQGAGIRVENAAVVRLEGAHVLESGTGLAVVGGGEVPVRFDRFVKVPTW